MKQKARRLGAAVRARVACGLPARPSRHTRTSRRSNGSRRSATAAVGDAPACTVDQTSVHGGRPATSGRAGTETLSGAPSPTRATGRQYLTTVTADGAEQSSAATSDDTTPDCVASHWLHHRRAAPGERTTIPGGDPAGIVERVARRSCEPCSHRQRPERLDARGRPGRRARTPAST